MKNVLLYFKGYTVSEQATFEQVANPWPNVLWLKFISKTKLTPPLAYE